MDDLENRYFLVLTDLYRPQEPQYERLIIADIRDHKAITAACEGIEVVVHLAADPRPDAPWESLLQNNIIGAHHVFEAASRSGCKRVIFASSGHTVFGHDLDEPMAGNLPPLPINLYGASKVWGEALARVYVEKGLSCICLRLGWVRGGEGDELRSSQPNLEQVLTPKDFTSLVIASIEASDDLRYGVFHGLSDNRWKHVDIEITREQLDYQPQDDAYTLAGTILSTLWRLRRNTGRWLRRHFS